MRPSHLHHVTSWFKGYVDRFRDEDQALPEMMDAKLAHTARVAVFSRTLAERSGWTADRADLAEAGGWLHDVGRFSQWAEFGTYRDRISVDHAARGREVLEREGALDPLAAADRILLLEAVALHNRLSLPDAMADASRCLCALVRDADKLDIFDIVHAHLEAGNLGDIVPLLSPEPEVSAVLLDEVRNDRRASYVHARTHADFVLISVAWAYSLAYRATAQLAVSKNVIGRMAPFLPDEPEVHEVVSEAAAALERFSRS